MLKQPFNWSGTATGVIGIGVIDTATGAAVTGTDAVGGTMDVGIADAGVIVGGRSWKGCVTSKRTSVVRPPDTVDVTNDQLNHRLLDLGLATKFGELLKSLVTKRRTTNGDHETCETRTWVGDDGSHVGRRVACR
jgi:hypothetical protein